MSSCEGGAAAVISCLPPGTVTAAAVAPSGSAGPRGTVHNMLSAGAETTSVTDVTTFGDFVGIVSGGEHPTGLAVVPERLKTSAAQTVDSSHKQPRLANMCGIAAETMPEKIHTAWKYATWPAFIACQNGVITTTLDSALS